MSSDVVIDLMERAIKDHDAVMKEARFLYEKDYILGSGTTIIDHFIDIAVRV